MTFIHDFLQFQSWMDRLKAWQMKLQVSFEKKTEKQKGITSLDWKELTKVPGLS